MKDTRFGRFCEQGKPRIPKLTGAARDAAWPIMVILEQAFFLLYTPHSSALTRSLCQKNDLRIQI
jgi:hypothetical protein